MNSAFKEWIVKAHRDLDPDTKKVFLRTLKREPSRIGMNISRNIDKWAGVAAIQLEMPSICIIHDLNALSEEVLEVLRESFATEMVAII